MKLPHPLPGYPIGPLDGETGKNYGTSEAHAARLGPGRFAVDLPAPYALHIPRMAGFLPYDAGEDNENGVWRSETRWDAGAQVLWLVRYSHLIAVPAPEGCVGQIGRTGNTTGPHAHVVLWRNGVRVRPEDYIDFEGTSSLDPNTYSLPQVEEDGMTDEQREQLRQVAQRIEAWSNWHRSRAFIPGDAEPIDALAARVAQEFGDLARAVREMLD